MQSTNKKGVVDVDSRHQPVEKCSLSMLTYEKCRLHFSWVDNDWPYDPFHQGRWVQIAFFLPPPHHPHITTHAPIHTRPSLPVNPNSILNSASQYAPEILLLYFVNTFIPTLNGWLLMLVNICRCCRCSNLLRFSTRPQTLPNKENKDSKKFFFLCTFFLVTSSILSRVMEFTNFCTCFCLQLFSIAICNQTDRPSFGEFHFIFFQLLRNNLRHGAVFF